MYRTEVCNVEFDVLRVGILITLIVCGCTDKGIGRSFSSRITKRKVCSEDINGWNSASDTLGEFLDCFLFDCFQVLAGSKPDPISQVRQREDEIVFHKSLLQSRELKVRRLEAPSQTSGVEERSVPFQELNLRTEQSIDPDRGGLGVGNHSLQEQLPRYKSTAS